MNENKGQTTRLPVTKVPTQKHEYKLLSLPNLLSQPTAFVTKTIVNCKVGTELITHYSRNQEIKTDIVLYKVHQLCLLNFVRVKYFDFDFVN